VIDFLAHLTKERSNGASTINIRLACIHSFFRFMANRDPLVFEHCQRILSIPFKRTKSSTVEYLEPDEMKAILSAIDCKSSDGLRDYALFSLMHNTGARVQEVIDLHARAFQLERPFQVRLLGKRNKERLCPLWPETVDSLRSLLKQRGTDSKSDIPVFVSHRGERLSRYGVRYLLSKYVGKAEGKCPSLKKKRISPHTVRHSTAMHLLESGVDINTIRAWLGHVNLVTTNRYAEINLEMKRKVLEKAKPLLAGKVRASWKSKNILNWLEAL
jgi:site-specific recombinase XerD